MDAVIFWVESIFGSVLASLGLIFNTISIGVLASSRCPHHNTLFNKLLVCLIISHTIHILLAQLVHWWHELMLVSDHPDHLWVKFTFAYFLYPVRLVLPIEYYIE